MNKLNQVIVNNTVLVVDVFYSIKYDSICFIINNSNYIYKNSEIKIKEMNVKLNNCLVSLEYINVMDFIQIDNTNATNEFSTEFHMNIGIIKNIKNYTTESIVTIDIEIQNKFCKVFQINTNENMEYIDKKCLTTIHINQHDLIYKWIDYHKKIGFEKFIIYDNNYNETENNKLIEKYKDDILIINANWSYWINNSSMGQVVQQNHTIWKYSPKFLALTDIDEYINIDPKFLFNDEYSVVSIPNTFFGCGRQTNDVNSYNFIEKYLYREVQKDTLSRRKCIIKSINVDMFCVHIPITFDKKVYYLSFDEGYLNHYRKISYNKDHYCNCSDRCAVFDNSILNK